MNEVKVSPSQFLRRTGLTAAAMRVLEASGVVNPTRADTGWRQFSSEDVERALAWKAARQAARDQQRA